MKIVVTGTNGFVGRNLIAEVTERFPGAEICRLVRFDKGRDHEFAVDYGKPETLISCVALKNADYIFHVAGVTKALSREAFYEGNVMPAKHLLEALKSLGTRPKRFVLVSSQAAAGPSKDAQHLMSEQEEPHPVELYGESKLEAERIVRSCGDVIPFTILRPGVVYGPYDVDVLNIFKMTRTGINVYPATKGQFVSYIYVKDLVKAAVDAALSANTIGKTYFLCNDAPASWQEIQELVFKVAGKKFVSLSLPYRPLLALSYLSMLPIPFRRTVPLLNPQKMKMSLPEFWVASNRQAKHDFGFAPKFDLDSGLRETYMWYKKNNFL